MAVDAVNSDALPSQGGRLSPAGGSTAACTLETMDTAIGAALEVLLTVTGRFAVWLLSFGRWRGEPLGSEEGRIHGAAGGLSFVRDGRRVITHTGQLFAGIAFYAAILGLVVLCAAAA